MSGVIYLISSGELVELREQPYDSEDVLQGLLERYPNLLAGEQMDSTEPRRWLLVAREAGLPDKAESGARWSVDHLFLDQDGIPTIVEVKRSSDTRVRREVIGQMLDYAANAVLYWPVESIRALFEARCDRAEADADSALSELLGTEADSETFWQQVKTNLQAERIRLVFVADEISTELGRIVEFLNKQMDPAEVLAVEVKQYAGQEVRTLVPRVIGRTLERQQQRTTRQWDEESFLSEITSKRGKDEAATARAILEWAKSNSIRIWWGKGQQEGSFMPMFDYQGVTYWTLSVGTSGRVAIQFGMMRGKPPFDSENKRKELLRQLNAIPGVAIPEDAINRYPSIPLAVLRSDRLIEQFMEAFQWVVDEIRSSADSHRSPASNSGGRHGYREEAD